MLESTEEIILTEKTEWRGEPTIPLADALAIADAEEFDPASYAIDGAWRWA